MEVDCENVTDPSILAPDHILSKLFYFIQKGEKGTETKYLSMHGALLATEEFFDERDKDGKKDNLHGVENEDVYACELV